MSFAGDRSFPRASKSRLSYLYRPKMKNESLMSRNLCFAVALCAVMALSAQTASAGNDAQDGLANFALITPENVADLEMGFAFEGECQEFSPDGTRLATTRGVYDLASGRRLLPIVEHPYHHRGFSPDGTLVAVGSDGGYDIASGQPRFTALIRKIGSELIQML